MLAAGAGLVARSLLGPGVELAALGVGAAAAVFGALLALAGSDGARGVAIVLWGLSGALACQMTGGVAGPLAAWCLAPLAATAAFRVARLLPLGAAAAVAATGIAALGSLLLPLPHVEPAAAPWLGMLATATSALGLGAALVALHAAVRRRDRERDDVEFGLREVLANQPQLLLTLYPGGRVLEAYGQPPPGLDLHDIASRNFGEFVAADERPAVDEALQRAIAEGTAEIAFTPAHDPLGWCVLSLRRMSSIRIAGALRDARAQRSRETELDQARTAAEAQNAGKSRFLANMSHELRTPLNAIMGFSDIMRQRLFGPMSDRYAEYADLVHDAGAHLLELINDVLDMSKIEAERFELAREAFDARDAVSAVIRLMRGQAERAGVQLRGVLPSEALEVEADRRAIKQIALNLVSNALKFTPQNGSVTLTVQAVEEMLEIVVSDTGVGIAPGDLERLGTPFEQAGDATQRAAGAGLGLSLVRAFAKLHGGEMCLESTVGEGTTVTVRMPVVVLDPPIAVAPAEASVGG
ncbi:HAMP domain-containing sensor histidine kinase [Phenylobacterium sp.]|uniref:sensor histidine kinase n=1 Tax=Phenylobacterium sp. TaxID=1871053 RepID=UPI002DEAC998|nr:HAMP domain-containing sensor histidine kinase [Phenylobacterium sp.]